MSLKPQVIWSLNLGRKFQNRCEAMKDHPRNASKITGVQEKQNPKTNTSEVEELSLKKKQTTAKTLRSNPIKTLYKKNNRLLSKTYVGWC